MILFGNSEQTLPVGQTFWPAAEAWVSRR